MSQRAVILDPVGPRLSEDEKAFFRDINPWGFILFQRHCQSPDQVRALTDELRAVTGRETLPILIDEEGGPVQRLKPPFWRRFPSARTFGDLFAGAPEAGLEAARLNSRLLGLELARLGLTVDCLPVLDIPVPGAHDIIGERAYADTPSAVAALGRAAAQGLRDAGVLPVIKHVPGHGRAAADSHVELPVVDSRLEDLRQTDFAPFRALKDECLGMTAHVVYSAIDPDHAATLSQKVVNEVIRDWIGFDGALMTDDLSMKALKGDPGDLAGRALAAGCDLVLHCNGSRQDKRLVAEACPELSGVALQRCNRALEELARISAGTNIREDQAGMAQARLAALFAERGLSYDVA